MKVIEERPVMVFKNENKYSIGISNKKQDGSYENAFYPIQFNKGVELENKTKIYIKNAWLSFYNWEYEEKKGTTFFIKCSDFEEVKETIQKSKNIDVKTMNNEKDPFTEISEEIDITDNMLD